MISERPKRDRKPKIIWEAIEDISIASRAKKTAKKASRTNKTEALVLIAAEPLPPRINLDKPLPAYEPPLQIKKRQGKPSFEGLSAIDTFQKFIDQEIIGRIVTATNYYAQRARTNQSTDKQSDGSQPQYWHPTCDGEIQRYLGIWLYMSLHREIMRTDFWSETYNLGRFLSQNRFEQLHRYFSVCDDQAPREGFAWKLNPITTILRANCKRNWIAGTNWAVDEAMIRFRGRSKHKVQLKNKPIHEGYKVWALA